MEAADDKSQVRTILYSGYDVRRLDFVTNDGSICDGRKKLVSQ